MRKTFYLLFMVLLLTACSSDDDKKKEITLTLSESSLLFTANEEEKIFHIESNDTWVISNTPDWFTIDKKQGNGNQKITIKSSANPAEADRETTLTIKAGDKTKQLKVIQNGKNVTLTVSETELKLPAEENENTFDIQSNEAWTIIDIPEWLTLSKQEGEGNETITINATANPNEVKRETIITIKAGSKTYELAISQDGMIYTLSISYPALEYYAEGGALAIEVESNTTWTVTSGANWCVPDKEQETGNNKLIINTLENKLTTNRNTEVTITAGSVSKKLLIKQSRAVPPADNQLQFNLRDNGIRPGDELIKKQVEYKDPGKGGEQMTWDFSDLKIINNQYTVSYSLPAILDGTMYIMGKELYDIQNTEPNSLIVGLEHNTMYYYEIKDNKLLAVGHENPSIRLIYMPRMVSGIYPTYYNDAYKFDYKSTYLYSNTVNAVTEGYMETKADGYGTIKLPSGTITDVLRVKSEQLIKDLSVNDPDLQSTKVTTYRWYAKGYRYPVFETVRNVNPKNNMEIFTTAFYYPPSDHTYIQSPKAAKKSNEVRIINNATILKKMEKLKYKW